MLLDAIITILSDENGSLNAANAAAYCSAIESRPDCLPP